ncbi:MAG: glycosyltransferase family 2 protein [Patescibacteria group bacterium]|nr:glycosyltransferase family 2 protein [Patescibacteria group bacterium]
MTDKNPKVSVLIATHNRSRFLSRAVESVLSQSFKDLEVIISDCRSTDDTAEVARNFEKKDSRVHYFQGEPTKRIAATSNFGLKHARGQYVAILDDDDLWTDSEKIKKQVEFLDENPEYVACGGGMVAVDKNGKEMFKFLKPLSDKDIKSRALFANPMANSTTLFRMDAAKKVGLYDESLLQFADWDFWLKIGKAGKLSNFPEYFTNYTIWEKGQSFAKQRENAVSAVVIVLRYKRYYKGFIGALTLALLYLGYAYLPSWLRSWINPTLTRLKKTIFGVKK